MPKQKTGENDLHKLLGNDCEYNEGTICIVNEQINVNRMVFRAWAHEWASLKSQWLVPIRLERAESLITER